MLSWLAKQNKDCNTDFETYVNENPWAADIWTGSPLSTTGVKKRKCEQCAHGCKSPIDQAPIRKPTGLQSPAPLKRTLVTCPGHKAHAELQGMDPKTKLPLTALAMVFPQRMATALVADLETFNSLHPRRGRQVHQGERYYNYHLANTILHYTNEVTATTPADAFYESEAY